MVATDDEDVVDGAAWSPRVITLSALAFATGAAIVAVGRIWGLRLEEQGRNIVLFAPPVLGHPRPSVPGSVWLPAGVAVIVVAVLPTLVRRVSWPLATVATVIAAAAWWIALAIADGENGLTRGLEWEREYEPFVGSVSADPAGFLHGFVAQLPEYSIQIRGHPPGLLLLFAGLHRLGLSGPGWAAAVVLTVAATSVPAVLLAVRDVAGDRSARQVAPFVALAPAALWIATSADALYVGVTSWVVALLVLATNDRARRPMLLAVLAGGLAAIAALLSYGLVLMACVPVAVSWYRHRWRPVLVAASVAFLLVALMVPAGFWWFAGLEATRHEYDTLDVDRPYGYFLLNNLAAWGLALGPALVVAVVRLRHRGLWALAGGGIVAAMLANLSGLSEGEVERIWLPFTVWVSTALAVLGTPEREARLWLATQVVFTLVFFSLVVTYW